MLSALRTASAVTLSISLFLQTSTAASATSSAASASTSVVLSAMTYVGCFNSSTPLTNEGSYIYQTSGYCQPICVGKSQPVLGLTGGSYCYCGSLLPAKDSEQVDDSNCDTSCTGYGADDCGGSGYWSVYLTGADTEVANYVSSSSSTAGSSKTDVSSSTTTSPSVVTSVAPGKTVVITQSSNPTSTSSSAADTNTETQNKHKSNGPNTAGIAAGVVVGIVVLAALIGAGFFYMRRRNRRQIEEEYSKRTQAQDFMASGTGNQRDMSVRSAGNDSRLDPEFMAHHRLSDGSIADNQDYSRRILKVTNPDGS